jgi:DNA-binding NarL/FixJ family response regulator
MIRLIVADDHVVMREGLAGLLKDEPDFTVVGQASNGHEALDLIRRQRPDIALLDITMPGMSGLQVASQSAAYLPQVKILFLTMHEEDTFFFAALRIGAAGYVLKGAPSGELLSAIREVYAGGVYLTPKLAGMLVHDYLADHPISPADELLTPREREIVVLIGQGLTNQAIAERLTLTINTVKTHRKRIYEKLDLNDRSSLLEFARRMGMLPG